MNSEPSVRPRRYLAVWFPWLPIDRLRRQERRDNALPDENAPPVVVAEKIKGALRLAAVDPAAAQAQRTGGRRPQGRRDPVPVCDDHGGISVETGDG